MVLEVLFNIHTSFCNFSTAKEYLTGAISGDIKNGDTYSLTWAHNRMAVLYHALGQRDSAIYHALKGLTVAENIKLNEGILINSLTLSNEFESTDSRKALYSLF